MHHYAGRIRVSSHHGDGMVRGKFITNVVVFALYRYSQRGIAGRTTLDPVGGVGAVQCGPVNAADGGGCVEGQFFPGAVAP